MRRFVIHSLIFALLVLATLAGCEWALRQVPNSYRYKDTWMRLHGRQVRTLILGNSLSLEGIDPSLLGRDAFNLANSAQLPEHDAFLLRHYAPYDSLRTIIMVLSDNLLDNPLESVRPLSVRATYYQIYMGYNKHPWWSANNFELARLDVGLAKLRAYRLLRRQGRTLPCDSLGFAPEPFAERPVDWQRRGLEGELSDTTNFAANEARHLRHLADMAEFCKAHEIRLVLVSMPLWVPSRASSARRYRAAGAWLQRRYGALYLDWSEDRRFTSDDFADARHLNDRGAEKFTRLLMAELARNDTSFGL